VEQVRVFDLGAAQAKLENTGRTAAEIQDAIDEAPTWARGT
jgi:hypothetical protein